jgi:hypothetical protein
MSYDLAINNVRSRLLNGGDVWWDLSAGQYIVRLWIRALGVPGVSSLLPVPFGSVVLMMLEN